MWATKYEYAFSDDFIIAAGNERDIQKNLNSEVLKKFNMEMNLQKT